MMLVVLRNVTEARPISGYEYEVRINQRIIARGRVGAHRRTAGWPALVAAVAKAGRAQRRRLDP